MRHGTLQECLCLRHLEPGRRYDNDHKARHEHVVGSHDSDVRSGDAGIRLVLDRKYRERLDQRQQDYQVL